MTLLRLFSFCFVLTLTPFQHVWADYPLQVIRLESRSVDEIIPLIRPFVGRDGVVQGMNNQLIVRTSPERLSEIHKILEKIDRPPRRLVILVKQGQSRHRDRDHISAGASINIGDSAKLDIGRPVRGEDRLEARIGSVDTNSDRASTHSVQTLEGQPAYVTTGTAFPIPTEQRITRGGVVRYGTGVEYRQAATGFYVLPRINGDYVTLEISTHMDTPNRQFPSFDVQQANATVSGRVGEWIDIGRVNTEGQVTRSGILQRGKANDREHRRIQVLVEEIR